MNETEVREKIIKPWLNSVGISEDQIELETNFTIRLGRSERAINAKSDYLIKNIEGKNLFIIEAKATGVKLSDNDRDQAVSYARLISKGNIPPIAIVTNGLHTILYDVITKEVIDDQVFRSRFHNNPFQVSCDLSLKAEALLYLISLDASNLKSFCKNQIEYRTRLLQSDEIFSGKKYIPKLHVTRSQESLTLDKLLFKEGRRIVLVTGPPQKGKTSFLCHEVRRLMDEQNCNCLFYPAISLNTGILSAIKEDFHWVFPQESEIVHIVSKLDAILNSVNQEMTIFIDGLNEIDQKIAIQINEECERISSNRISIVLSATSNSLERLLFPFGNSSFMADSVNLSARDATLIKKRSIKNLDQKSIIQLEDFSQSELHQACSLYAKMYDVEVKSIPSILINPFLLRIAMEVYAGKKLPVQLADSELIHHGLMTKCSRMGIEQKEFIRLLLFISDSVIKYGAPLTNFHEIQIDGVQLQKLCETAVLAEVHDENNLPAIDFYYSRERDFVVACLLYKWQDIFISKDTSKIIEAASSALDSPVSREALRWFFSSPSHIAQLQKTFDTISNIKESKLSEILLEGVLNQNFETEERIQWLNSTFKKVIGIQNYDEREFDDLEPAAIVLFQIINSTIKKDRITQNQIACIKELILIDIALVECDMDSRESFSSKLIENHHYCIDLFLSFILTEAEPIAGFCSIIVVDWNADLFIKHLKEQILKKEEQFRKRSLSFIPGLEKLAYYQQDHGFCDPHMRYQERDEECIEGYIEYRDHYKAIIGFYSKWSGISSFEDELLVLKGYAQEAIFKYPDLALESWVIENAPELVNSGFSGEIPTTDPNQLHLPL